MDGTPGTGAAPALPVIEELSITSLSVPSGTVFNVNQSFPSSVSEDPFADDFFQTSFESPSASVTTTWPGGSMSATDQTEDPFDVTSSFGAAWGTTENQATGVSDSIDPFQDIPAPTISQMSSNSDPFQETTPTSGSVSFDFGDFSAQSITTPSSAQMPPTSTFEEGFGSDLGALDGIVSTDISSVSIPPPLTQPDSQPGLILNPPPVTTPRRANVIQKPAAAPEEGFAADWGLFGDNVSAAISSAPAGPPSRPQKPTPIPPPPPVTTPKRPNAVQVPPATSEDGFGSDLGGTTTTSPAPVPPPLPKRDSAALMPPPVTTPRRANTTRNQPASSRSRPRPSVDQTPKTDEQVILSRPAKSKPSPDVNRTRTSNNETSVPLPSLDGFGAEADIVTTSFDAVFEMSGPDNQGSNKPTALTVASDPFQDALPPPAVSTSQATITDLFQDSLPPPAVSTSQATITDLFQDSSPPPAVSTSQATISDLFQDSLPPLAVSTSQANISDPFQDGLRQPANPTGQAIVSDPFQDGPPSPAVSASQANSISDPFQDGMLSSLSVSQPRATNSNPFQSAFPSSAQSRAGIAAGGGIKQEDVQVAASPSGAVSFEFGDPPIPTSSSQQEAVSSRVSKEEDNKNANWPSFGFDEPVQTGSNKVAQQNKSGGTVDWSPFDVQADTQPVLAAKQVEESSWSVFGDVGPKQQQQDTSSTGWSPFGSTGDSKQANRQEGAVGTTGWPVVDSTPAQQQQQQQQPTSSFSGFGDNWDGGGSVLSTSKSQPAAATTSNILAMNAPAAVSATSQGKAVSNWDSFGKDSPMSTPSMFAQSQPQQQQQQQPAQPTMIAILNPPPGKSNRDSSSPATARSRPRTRSSGNSVMLNLSPSSSQRTRSGVNAASQSRSPHSVQASAASVSSKSTVESRSNPLNKSETTIKKSGGYLDELSSLSMPSQQPQISPMTMSFQGGPSFQQPGGGPPGGWGGPSGPQPPFPQQIQPPQQQQQQQQQPPVNFPYGHPAGGQGMPIQQQQFMQHQQQQAMLMRQQQQAMQMQQGPMPMQQGSMQMQQGPMPMQQGPMSMQRGPVPMQQGPMSAQQGPGVSMQQGPMGTQFLPGGPQMMGPPGGQMQPPRFSTPQQQQQQQQNFYQQNPNTFSPIGQPNPLSPPGNVSMGPGGGQFSISGGSNLSTSNLYTSDFSSPPYAVGSSTPQSGAQIMVSPPQPPPPPPPVQYRPSANYGR